jgi:hypothetical protein
VYQTSTNSFGMTVHRYQDCDFVTVDRDAQGIEVMGYDEAGGTSSIYCCTFGDQGVTGLQSRAAGRLFNITPGSAAAVEIQVSFAPVLRDGTIGSWVVAATVALPAEGGRVEAFISGRDIQLNAAGFADVDLPADHAAAAARWSVRRDQAAGRDLLLAGRTWTGQLVMP